MTPTATAGPHPSAVAKWGRTLATLVTAMRLNPADRVLVGIAADAAGEAGFVDLESRLRNPIPGSESDGCIGSGGIGSGGGGSGGIGSGGIGIGIGSIGSGGIGSGGIGSGGIGIGSGGIGSGSDGGGSGSDGGIVRFNPNSKGAIMRAVGERVMLLVPGSYSNFVWVGEVAEELGGHVYRLQNTSMVLVNGNGHDWPALARGQNRVTSQFSYAGEVDVGPQIGGVLVWEGELPPAPAPPPPADAA